MITVRHIFWNDVAQEGYIDGSYDNEGTALRHLGELFYHDESASIDYDQTIIKDLTTGKYTLINFREPVERKALELKQREIGEKVKHDLQMAAWREEQLYG